MLASLRDKWELWLLVSFAVALMMVFLLFPDYNILLACVISVGFAPYMGLGLMGGRSAFARRREGLPGADIRIWIYVVWGASVAALTALVIKSAVGSTGG